MPCPHPLSVGRTRPLRCAIAVSLALVSLAVVAQGNVPDTNAPDATLRNWDIAAAPLADTLARIARDSGQRLSADPALINGKTAAPVRGKLTAPHAASQALTGTGLELIVTEGGTLTVRPAPRRPKDEEATLAPVSVKAEVERESAWGPVNGYMARRSATATKTDTPIIETPQSISVVTADQISNQASNNLQDALRYTAGVRYESYGLDNRGDWFSLRGGDASRLLDGLRYPGILSYGGVRDEPYALERIEVLRGPASLIAGQNGPGGVVNMISKRPQIEPAKEISVQAGSHGHKQLATDLSGPLDAQGEWLYRIVALARETGTQVSHTNDERIYFRPSLTWRPNNGTTLTVFAEYQKDESNNTNAFFPIVGTLKEAPNGRIPTNTFIGEPSWDSYGGTRKRFGWEIEHKLNDTWTLRHHMRHDSVNAHLLSMYAAWWDGFVNSSGASDFNGKYLNRSWYGGNETYHITSSDLLAEARFQTGSVQHTLLIGADTLRLRDQYGSADEEANPLNVYEPTYGSFAKPDLSSAASFNTSTTRANDWGLLLQDQMKIDEHLVVVAGIRRDSTRANTNESTQSDQAISRNLGLLWLGESGFAPYIGYSESFRPVIGYHAYDGSQFKPKQGKQVEAGIKWQSADQRLTASAATYRSKETNRPALDQNHVDYYKQFGEVTVNGIEFEMAARLRQWDLIAQYSRTNARVTRAGDDETQYIGQQLASEPKNSAALWAVHRFSNWGLPNLRMGMGARHIGTTGDGTAGGNRVSSVTLFDALVGYAMGSWNLALNINNLTDKAYIATCMERGDCWFGTQRKAIGTLTYRW